MIEENFIQSEEMVKLFISEAEEYLELLEQSVVKLEKDLQNPDLLDNVFRAVHTLKSMAATMEFKDIAALSHEMENLFYLLRAGRVKVTLEMVTLFLKCRDTLKLLKDEVISGENKKNDLALLIDELKKLQ